jgi:hypothetical protein
MAEPRLVKIRSWITVAHQSPATFDRVAMGEEGTLARELAPFDDAGLEELSTPLEHGDGETEDTPVGRDEHPMVTHPIGGGDVLAELVRPDAEEVDDARDLVGTDRRRRHLDHDPGRAGAFTSRRVHLRPRWDWPPTLEWRMMT